MDSTNSLVYAFITIILFGLIAGLILWAIEVRPIVGYQFQECENQIYSDSSQSVALGILNSGNTDATVVLHFSGENITILNTSKKPYIQMNDTDARIFLTATKNSKTYYYDEKIYFMANKNVKSFSYTYDVIKQSDWSISGLVNIFFGEIKLFYPVKCSYKQISDGRFELV